jgi:hypothetical protein
MTMFVVSPDVVFLLMEVHVNAQLKSSVMGFVPPVSAIHARLVAWNMSTVKKYAVEKGIYTAEEIDAVEAEYKKFLALCVAYPDSNFPVSRKVDDLWHTHLLFTQDYAAMCQEQVGHFLHHRPKILDDEAGLKRAFGDTLGYYARAFGTPDPTYWDDVVCRSVNCPGP